MATAGVMQLHHEDRALPWWQGLARLQLAGLGEAALAAVLAQAHGRPFGLGAQALAHAGRDRPDPLHGHAQRLCANTEGLGAVLRGVGLIDVDAVAVRRADVARVVTIDCSCIFMGGFATSSPSAGQRP